MSDNYCVYLFNEANSALGSLNPSTFLGIDTPTGSLFTFIMLAALFTLFASFFGGRRMNAKRETTKGINSPANRNVNGFRRGFEDWDDQDGFPPGGIN